ncbi:MAG TPA: hypothetical protein VGH23_08625 [Rhizomicrobium sp.]|jgi:hypothetical protein
MPRLGLGEGDVMDTGQLWRIAAELLKGHGEAAEAEALKRADAAIDGGDVDGFNRWKCVARLIVEMQSKTPSGHVH